MTGRVRDKVVIVTGAAGGIGGATARLLAHEGAHVLATDLDSAGLARRAEQGIATIVHDVCCEKAWAEVIAAATDRFGDLDGLVNNAGVGTPPHDPETTTLDQWQRMIDTNLKSVFLGTRAAIPAMRARGGGAIVNLSSIHGLTGAPRASAYGAAKGGVRSYTKATALHCARTGSGVRANSVHPGFIETPMLAKAFRARGEEAAQRATAIAQVPLGRIGTPEQVAQAILFLISDESSYITGVELAVDGGYTAA